MKYDAEALYYCLRYCRKSGFFDELDETEGLEILDEDDAWEIVKALEFYSKNVNLCDSCTFEFATCKSSPGFGNGFGNDNVYRCASYKEQKNEN